LENSGLVSAQGRSSKKDPRAAIKELCEKSATWPYADPIIEFSDDVTHKAKENTRDPTLYIRTDGSDSIERFSADGVSFDETATVGIDVWVLDVDGATAETAAYEYRTRLLNLFSDYTNDNFDYTEFHNIEPTEATDFRQEHVARQTDHYIYTVTIEVDRLQEEF
jgi:hypothetical protein